MSMHTPPSSPSRRPTPPWSPVLSPPSAKDLRGVRPSRFGTPQLGRKISHFPIAQIQEVFSRHGWKNPSNGTWQKNRKTVQLPEGPMVSRIVAKELLAIARAQGSPPHSPKHRRH